MNNVVEDTSWNCICQRVPDIIFYFNGPCFRSTNLENAEKKFSSPRRCWQAFYSSFESTQYPIHRPLEKCENFHADGGAGLVSDLDPIARHIKHEPETDEAYADYRISPLIPILAPASLSVVPRGLKVVPAPPMQINNFNFSLAANISDPKEVNIIEASTQTETNRLTLRGTDTLTEINKLRRRQSSSSSASGRQDVGSTYSAYTKPTNRLTALIAEAVYNGQIVQSPSPCGENCTFTQSFVGPTYQCTEMDPYDTSSPWCSPAGLQNSGYANCSEVWEVFGASPRSTLYEASNSSADFCTNLSSNPGACNSSFTSTTEAWENGNIWVRYKYLPEYWRDQFQENKSVPANAWMNLSYRCDQWDARFDLNRTYNNSVQQVEVNTTSVFPAQLKTLIILFPSIYEAQNSVR
jgi:hypothetical protein